MVEFVVLVQLAIASDDFLTLECPQGWKAFGQAWYVPKPENEDWTDPSVISPLTMENYYESFYYKNGTRVSAMCLICELQCKNLQGKVCNGKVMEFIEICSYQSETLLQLPATFEINENFPKILWKFLSIPALFQATFAEKPSKRLKRDTNSFR